MATQQQGQQPDITILFKDPTLWTGGIATHLLDQIYIQQLSEVQRELLLSFSTYREPVPFILITDKV